MDCIRSLPFFFFFDNLNLPLPILFDHLSIPLPRSISSIALPYIQQLWIDLNVNRFIVFPVWNFYSLNIDWRIRFDLIRYDSINLSWLVYSSAKRTNHSTRLQSSASFESWLPYHIIQKGHKQWNKWSTWFKMKRLRSISLWHSHLNHDSISIHQFTNRFSF